MLKKFFALFLTIGIVSGLMAGCGTSSSSSGSDLKELRIGFVPSQNAETLEARAKPLADLLQKELGIPVKVTVTTDYNGVVEAMGSKQLELGFLPPTDYVLAHQKKYANVLLQALRFGVDPKTGANTSDKVSYYYAGILVRNDSGIKSLNDLKGKTIGWQSPTSSAGYVWPAVEMKEKAGIDAQKDVKSVVFQGHDKAVLAVLNKDVDAAAVFEDARNIVKGEYPNVFKDTHYIYQTAKIPNDTISIRPDISKKWADKIANAFIKIGNDPKGQKIIESIYTHEGYQKASDSTFDVVRDYSDKVKNIGK
ncbi:phosphate/phosphite/phosphonate ABC transporter substrate-binding protein [Heyndrickxia acidicola]|jgi:phosphonate transport system substrate-binding protein|uniref:Phosphate/phosphite/phosphonate ABC transporter substrate-binding protein n=1 Tax=Heyndrickxia acidicola TaxID=209389 RepID=A0ABU6MDW2_9BACI|nr:phosphate/phosphite/phosphonate ABC transporter substrate-binding protein [Heyndrickxia acidicola]MED1202838.1 phosphate/phosphite/phosphonate ABC transporter substrate-binding protein [Heyndrickxia acidicola]